MQLVVEHQGQGLPILCLHGHPGNGASMRVFTHHLASRYHTLAPDLRGYGRSRTHQPFDMSAHVDDLVAVMDAYAPEQCLVLGWSLGGILAMELALRYPNRIAGLILIATAARPRSNHPPVTWQDYLYTGLASLVNRVRPGWPWVINTLGRRSLYRYLLQQHSEYAYQKLAFEGLPAYFQTSRWADRALAQALHQGYDRLSDIPQIDAPCLVIAGACDCHITAQSSRETAEHLPNSQFREYPQAAHLLPWEFPTQLLADIDIWLAQQNFRSIN